jgi:hypothetical protein
MTSVNIHFIYLMFFTYSESVLSNTCNSVLCSGIYLIIQVNGYCFFTFCADSATNITSPESVHKQIPEITNSTEKSSRDANSPSDGQEILRLSWGPKVHCLIHDSPRRVSILGQINSVHILKSCICNNHFNIILQCCVFPSRMGR